MPSRNCRISINLIYSNPTKNCPKAIASFDFFIILFFVVLLWFFCMYGLLEV